MALISGVHIVTLARLQEETTISANIYTQMQMLQRVNAPPRLNQAVFMQSGVRALGPRPISDVIHI